MWIIAIICGIPGSGKSTFSRRIATQLPLIELSIKIEVISFDDFEVAKNEQNAESFKIGRQKAVSHFERSISSFSNDEKDSNRLIIVDDIMHLKSMRKEIISIVKCKNELLIRNNSPLLWYPSVIHVKTPLEVAKARNLLRSKEFIEENVIDKIFQSFEEFGVQITLESDDSTGEYMLLHESSVYNRKCGVETVGIGLWNIWNELYHDYIANMRSTYSTEAPHAEATIHSVNHNIDLILRKLISITMTDPSLSMYILNKKQFSLHLSRVKQSIMGSDMSITRNAAGDSACDDIKDIDSCICGLFILKVKEYFNGCSPEFMSVWNEYSLQLLSRLRHT